MKASHFKQASLALLTSACLLNVSHAFAVESQQAINPPVAGAVDALAIRKAFRLENDPLVSVVQKNADVEFVLRGLAQKANLNLIFLAGGSSGSAPSAAAPAGGAGEDAALLELERLASDSAPAAGPSLASTGATMNTIPYLELKNVPLSEAFALILQMTGLSGRRVYNSLMIASPEKMAEMGFASSQIKTYTIYNMVSARALRTASVQSSEITNALPTATDAQPIVEQLKKIYASRNVKPVPEMVFDGRTSTLILIGSQEAIDIADHLIPILDKPLPQVVVEIKMIELTKRGSQALGMTYGYGQGKFGASFSNSSPLVTDRGPGNPITADGEGAITFSTLGNVVPNFNVRLNALINENQAKVLINPRLTIQHGVTAVFNSTTDVPILSTTVTATAATQTVNTLNIGEILEITPFIDQEKNMITMRLNPQISTRGQVVAIPGQAVPEVNRKQVQTLLRVPDGDTVIIGGLMRKSNFEDTSKIPVLGDIPLLGALFSDTTRSQEDVEVVIMVTPRILATP